MAQKPPHRNGTESKSYLSKQEMEQTLTNGKFLQQKVCTVNTQDAEWLKVELAGNPAEITLSTKQIDEIRNTEGNPAHSESTNL
jgi:hypothetical protein